MTLKQLHDAVGWSLMLLALAFAVVGLVLVEVEKQSRGKDSARGEESRRESLPGGR